MFLNLYEFFLTDNKHVGEVSDHSTGEMQVSY
jgi:hypothetical protein